MRKYEKCGHDGCENDAKWCYDPGYSSGCSPYFCDDHVHRGCSCNTYSIKEEYRDLPKKTEIEGVDWEWLKVDDQNSDYEIKVEKTYWRYIDEKGRPYPCCEYTSEEKGFVTEEYEQWLEEKCKEIGYDLLTDEIVLNQNWFKEHGEYFWSDELIEKVEKIIEEKCQINTVN